MTARPLPQQTRGREPSRADLLSALVTVAFDALFWISEAPNRAAGEVDGTTLELAERARAALVHIEANDPDQEWTGP